MILLLVGALGFMYLTQKNQTDKNSPPMPTSRPSTYQPAQPSQVYPFVPITPPRVDNKNQPWYNGARQFMATPGDTVKGLAGDVSSVVHSLSDVWGNLNDWFGGDDAKANLASTDSLPSDDYDMDGSADDQSDSVGQLADDTFDYDMSTYESPDGSYDYSEDYYA